MRDEKIYLKDSPNLRIPYIEQLGEIVANANVKTNHLGLKDILDKIKKVGQWTHDIMGYQTCM